jgi:hypothetical protein
MTLGELSDRAAQLTLEPRFMAIPQIDFDELCERHPDSVFSVTRGCLEPAKAISVGHNWFAVPSLLLQQNGLE